MDVGFRIIVALLAAFLAALASSGVWASQHRDGAIVLILNNWASQQVLTEVYADLLRRNGFDVAETELDIANQFGALARGAAHVQVEAWATSAAYAFDSAIKSGDIKVVGYHTAHGREGWWYPGYMKERCPGLPDWHALRKCAKVFQTGETAPKGRYIAGIWDNAENLRIDALGLPFKALRVRYDRAFWTAFRNAYRNHEPILFYNWTTHWSNVTFKGEYVDFPAFEPACLTDPAWGPNPKKTHDCNIIVRDRLMKVAWANFQYAHPCAYRILKNMEFDDHDLQQLAYRVDMQNKPAQTVAQSWLDKHEDTWSDWMCR